jgi:succinate dehydrogenase / fumarate reductase, cytochrome b subunit
MTRPVYQTSIGQKWIVALTGLILIGFATGHMIGNLQVFLPPAWMNAYAKHLEDLGPLLWVIRVVLLGTIILHFATTIHLALANRRARPERYAVQNPQAATLAARTMIYSGLVLVAFIGYHLAHFTVRATNPEFNQLFFDLHGEQVRDVHKMVILGFQSPLVAGFYILGVFLLALHLSHGSSSFLQTLSLNNRKLSPLITRVGQVYAWFLFAGYAAIPAAVFLHLLK